MQVLGPLEKARHYVESHSKPVEIPTKINAPKFQPGPCITISRETGAGANEVIIKLIEFFQLLSGNSHNNWTVADTNLVEKILNDNHLPHTLINFMGEEKYSSVKSIMGELFGGHPSIWSIVYKASEAILQLGQIGNCIILDRGGSVITANLKHAFHVRLVAPLDYRIQHVMEIFDMDKKTAMNYIKKEEKDRKDYMMNYFHKDIADSHLYDIVINTKLINADEASRIIGNTIINEFPELFMSRINLSANEI